jgi:hypothetical protein
VTEPWAEVHGVYPSRQELLFAKEWAANPPEKLEHLVASVPAQVLLRFARAAEDIMELRAALSRRRELLTVEGPDAADLGELREIEAWLKKRAIEMAQPEASL